MPDMLPLWGLWCGCVAVGVGGWLGLAGRLRSVDYRLHSVGLFVGVCVVTVATPPRWMPDEQLVPAVLAGSDRAMRDLSTPDRCWLVAGLGLAGLTADDIADRLDCSLRLVRSIRAEDLTMVCVIMQRESRNFTDELRLERSEHAAARQALIVMSAAHDRVKLQLDRLLDAHIVSGAVKTCSNGHALVPYNVYRRAGRNYCRECRRIWDTENRCVTSKSVSAVTEVCRRLAVG